MPSRPSPHAPASRGAPPRLVSLDAYRGFVMLLMASEGFGIPCVASHFKDSRIWQFLAHQIRITLHGRDVRYGI